MSSESKIVTVNVDASLYGDWKATWWWPDDISEWQPHTGWGDEGKVCEYDGTQLEFLRKHVLPTELKVGGHARVRVKLIAPGGRRHEFMGYAHRAKDWVDETLKNWLSQKVMAGFVKNMVQSVADHMKVPLPYATGSPVKKAFTALEAAVDESMVPPPDPVPIAYGKVPMDALAKYATSQFSLPSQYYEFVKATGSQLKKTMFKEGSTLAKVEQLFKPTSWQDLFEKGQASLYLKPPMTVGYDAAPMKPIPPTVVHNITAKPAGSGWLLQAKDGFAVLSQEDVNMLCWGHPAPLEHALQELTYNEATLLFDGSHKVGVVWPHKDGSLQKVLLKSEKSVYAAAYIVSGFGSKHKLSFSEAMKLGVQYG